MKKAKSLLFALLILTVCQVGSSQVREQKLNMSLGVQPGLSVSIPGASQKFIEKVLKDYLKPSGKLKENKKAKEYYIAGATIRSINAGAPLDLYVSTGEQSAVMHFDLKTSFLNSTDHPTAYDQASAFVQEFSYEVQRTLTRELLEEEEEKLEKLNDRLNDLGKDNNKFHKEIEKARETIQKRENDLLNNAKEQEMTKVQIDSQTKMVEEVQKKLNAIGKAN
ncbi:MAG: hypothetical protein KBF37_07380 [Saprospiraceae bacterium]|jgi:hypothetical protein|nr:hypothetical protein [Saprospiraceae bacterium]MBP9210124.1 hypothetical protein [Saprospiraceae bacterium]